MESHHTELVVRGHQHSLIHILGDVEPGRSIRVTSAIFTALDSVLNGLRDVCRRVPPPDVNGRDVDVEEVHFTWSRDGNDWKGGAAVHHSIKLMCKLFTWERPICRAS